MVDGIPDHKLPEIFVISSIASVLSILGCLFIIAMYIKFKDLRKLGFRLITILALFDLANTVIFLIPTYTSESTDDLCIFQGILINFTTLLAVFWATFITLTLYAIVVKGYLNIENLIKNYLIFAFIASLLISLIPLLIIIEESDFGTCWLYKGGGSKTYRLQFLTFLIPLWAIIFVNLILYLIVFRNLRCAVGGEAATIRRKISKKISMYPLIIIICYLPFTIKGIIEIGSDIKKSEYEYSSTIITNVIRCLIGLFNALAYGLNKDVTRKIFGSRMSSEQKKINTTLIDTSAFK